MSNVVKLYEDQLICPCCDRPLMTTKNNILRAHLFEIEEFRYAPPKVVEFLLALADAGGRPAGRDYIIHRLWPDGEAPMACDSCIKRYTNNARNLIRESNLSIRTLWGRGYQLIVKGED